MYITQNDTLDAAFKNKNDNIWYVSPQEPITDINNVNSSIQREID